MYVLLVSMSTNRISVHATDRIAVILLIPIEANVVQMFIFVYS
jgi:hypothetical protein